jgi:riboflavin synthase
MFTGIVQSLGIVWEVTDQAMTFHPNSLGELSNGDSVSVNGVCLTVKSVQGNSFSVDVMPETLNRSNLGDLISGDTVNLEEALTLNTHLGGHFLQGHIDAWGEVSRIILDGDAILITFSAPDVIIKYIVEKGFIAVDGVSLTVTGYSDDELTVSVVQYTRDNTIIGDYKIGSKVNLEVDILAKYIEKFLASR